MGYKNQDRISDEHKCRTCHLTKRDVQFRITVGFNTYTPEKFCVYCKPKRLYKPRGARSITDRIRIFFETGVDIGEN